MAFRTSRTFTVRGRPPRLAGGISEPTSAHSASVKSLSYRRPRRSAAARCSGFHMRHLSPTQVPPKESQPIPPTQLLSGTAIMNRRRALGLCAIAVATIALFPIGSVAQGKSLKDQLIGTWIYVSSTAKRDDGSNVQQPSSQGAVTYTSDGRFHFILTRTDLPKYASNDRTRPSPEEAIAIAAGTLAYNGTYMVDENTKNIHANIEISTF